MPDNDYVPLESATQLLRQLLGAHSPELGARLKQRLIASVREQGLGRFDERALGFKGFRIFLEKTQAGWLQISRPPDESGDIQVSLRDQPAPSAAGPARAMLGLRFRSEVWQAFTNPDPARKRFLHKRTGQVTHFKNGERSPEQAAFSAHPGDYAEIEFIEGNQQLQWMEEFLNAVPIVGEERKVIESLRSTSYSSAMNAAFSRALGDKQDHWREFRTSRVATAILDWAAKHSVDARLLEQTGDVPEVKAVTAAAALGIRGKEVLSPRQDTLKLLDLLTDQEIKRVVIPVLLSTMLLRSRA